jgi:hypothetical protein
LAKKLITTCVVVSRKIDRFAPRAMTMRFFGDIAKPAVDKSVLLLFSKKQRPLA